MNEPVLEARAVEYHYPGGQIALTDISFSIGEGERVAIMGANASGKSTLLHLLDGLYFADRGEVRALGTVLTEESVETPPFSRLFRQQVGFLFQNSDAQLFSATVEEELAFGPVQLGLTEAEVDRRVDDVVEMLHLGHLCNRSPLALSAGEKKRVALAGLITCGPRVILLDEPSAGLDPRTCVWLTDFLDLLHKSGVTLITASHDLEFVSGVADRALILAEDHRIAYDGPLRTALADSDLLASVNLVQPRSTAPV